MSVIESFKQLIIFVTFKDDELTLLEIDSLWQRFASSSSEELKDETSLSSHAT